jgi:hypothetical protein
MAALIVPAAAPAEAPASNLVFVCGKNLCAATGEGRDRLALTHDGRARAGYTRPSLARTGKRLAFKLGDPGRVWTAKVKRRRGRIVGLGRRTRIDAFRDGPRDATQFDVAISPGASARRGSRSARTWSSEGRTSGATRLAWTATT